MIEMLEITHQPQPIHCLTFAMLPTRVWIKIFLNSMTMHEYHKHMHDNVLNDSQQITETSSLFRTHDPVKEE